MEQRTGKVSGTQPTGRPGTSGVPIRIHEEREHGTTPGGNIPSGGDRGPTEFRPEEFKENASRLLNDVKNLAYSRVRYYWEGINRGDTWDRIVSTYVQSSLKFDEVKHILEEVMFLPIHAQLALCHAACKNLCERQELLKRYLEDFRGKELKSKKKSEKFCGLEKEYLEAIQRFVELVLCLGLIFQDTFECGINEYALSIQKAHRYRERYDDFKRFKGKMDPITYKKNRVALCKEKMNANKEAACAKVCTEEIYHKTLHFYQDVSDTSNDVMEFLRTRGDEINNLFKGKTETVIDQQCLQLLNKRYNDVRDLLDEVIRISRDKIPQFSNKKEVENLVTQRRRLFEGTQGGTFREGTQRTSGTGAEK